MKNLIKKILVICLIIGASCNVSTNFASSPALPAAAPVVVAPQSPAVRPESTWGVLKHDILSIGKHAVSATANMAKLSKQAFGMLPARIQSRVLYVTPVLAAVAGYSLWNRKKLHDITKKYDLDHPLLGNMPGAPTKFHKWGYQEWPSASHVKAHKTEIINAFSTANNEDLKIIINETKLKERIEALRVIFAQDSSLLEERKQELNDTLPPAREAATKSRSYGESIRANLSSIKTKITNWWNGNAGPSDAAPASQSTVAPQASQAASSDVIAILNGNQQQPNNKELVEKAIYCEELEFWVDLKKLERQHCVYANFKPITWFNNGFGILYDYKNVCAAQGADPFAPSSWTPAQYIAIDDAMRNTWCQNKWWHYVFKHNYGKAASVYWELFKKHQRLMMLKQIIRQHQGGLLNVLVTNPVANWIERRV